MTQAELRARHGTPEAFEKAVWRAYAQLFITYDEAVDAIAIYRQEWDEAAHETSQDQASDSQVLRLEGRSLG
jgi:hypothetical protein